MAVQFLDADRLSVVIPVVLALVAAYFLFVPRSHHPPVAKTLNFATNFAALLVFLVAGKIVWLVGGVMIVGQLVGAYVGSHLLLRANPLVLRVLIVVVSLGMLARVLLG